MSESFGKKTGHVFDDEIVARRNLVGNDESVSRTPVFGNDQFFRLRVPAGASLGRHRREKRNACENMLHIHNLKRFLSYLPCLDNR